MFRRTINRNNYLKLSSIFTTQRYNLSNIQRINQNKQEDKLKNVSDQDFLVKLKNDPDVFGTKNYDDELTDEDDIKEQKFLEEKPLRSQQLSIKQYSVMIKLLIDKRKIKEAIDILEIKMIKEDRVKPDDYIYNLIIGACGRVGYTKKAFSLYNDMKKRGLKVCGGTYTALFNACANSPFPNEDIKRAKRLREIMTEKMYEPNDSNYNSMIKAFGRCGDLSTAFSIVDEMRSKKMKIYSDTINFLLQACITDKESGFRHALLVWQKLYKFRIKPEVFTYNLMLKCIKDCNLGDINITKNVISKIMKTDQIFIDNSNKLLLDSTSNKKLLLLPPSNENSLTIKHENTLNTDDLTPNLMSKNPHLGSMISLSEIKKPEERLLLVGGLTGFLESMKFNQCEPNIKTLTQLIELIPNSEILEKQIISLIKKFNLKYDVGFFNVLIKKRSLRFDYIGARNVINMMTKFNLKPNLITYGILSLSCKTKEEAMHLIYEMKEHKYRLNAEILGGMLNQACYHNEFSYILHIMDLCVKENIQPNKKFIEHLDKFKGKCRKMINNEKDELGQSKNFKMAFQFFRNKYKLWLTQVNIDNSQDIHPWQQFQQETDEATDKYFKDKERSSKFKKRHLSKFRVKTSKKYRNK